MAPEVRRQAIIDATLPLLHEHGRVTTTKQIADAAGIAEGTIFRVFESKDELFAAALEHAFDFGPFIGDLGRIEPDQPLRGRLLDIVTMTQIRFRGIFGLMASMGMTAPPVAQRHKADARARVGAAMVALVAPDADALTCTPEDLVHRLRLLTFSATHPHISDGQTLSAAQIVDTICDGLLKKDTPC